VLDPSLNAEERMLADEALAQTQTRIVAALSALTPLERRIVAMLAQGRDAEAIGTALDMTPNAVLIRVCRLRAKARGAEPER
jgi:DNA-binding CsgD family transcriptional regulator